jgi:endonuclease/exonuclease/phosphatase family metal-dependent hydrolase
MRSKKRVNKKTIKKKTIKKRINNMSGGNPKFTVMSFNVECWLNQLDKNFFKNFIENNDTSILSKWQQLKDIFNGVDIACIQENAVIKQNDGFKNFISKIGNLNLISSCQSHDFHWPQTQGLYGVGSKISNSIYAKYGSATDSPLKSQLTIDGKDTIDTYLELTRKKEKHPRCWAISEIPIVGKKVKVASIHLSGGRFDDIASLSDENYLIKTNQIHKLLEEKPDIVCGDLNTKLVRPEVDDYFNGLLKADNKSYTRSIADKWNTWMYGLDKVFKESGYNSVFEGSEAPVTSIFGGTVDMIYYKPDILTCSDSYAVEGAMELGKRILSDHAPIKAEFAFK